MTGVQTCALPIYIDKADYYSMGISSEHLPSVTDHNDHTFEAEENREVSVKGIASISIDLDNLNPDVFSECFDIDRKSVV